MLTCVYSDDIVCMFLKVKALEVDLTRRAGNVHMVNACMHVGDTLRMELPHLIG